MSKPIFFSKFFPSPNKSSGKFTPRKLTLMPYRARRLHEMDSHGTGSTVTALPAVSGPNSVKKPHHIRFHMYAQ